MSTALFESVSDLLLEVEVPVNQLQEFIEKYRSIAGEEPDSDFVKSIGGDKWGLEARVYFNCSTDLVLPIEDAYHVEEFRNHYRGHDYTYRVNQVKLFWDLVDVGYKLGRKS